MNFEGRCWLPFFEFLLNMNAIININTINDNCFGFAFFTLLNVTNYQQRNAFDRVFTTNKCFIATISTLFYIQFILMMFIFIKLTCDEHQCVFLI